MSLITTPQMLYQYSSLKTHFAVPSQRPRLLYDMHTDARLVSVCVSTLYMVAPCPQSGVFSTPLAWDRAKVGERRPGEVPQPSSHTPTCPIPPPVPSCTPLSTWSTTVHLLSSSAAPPSLRTTQLGDTVNCNQRCRS